ncbi:MAG: hypothetical protein JWM95_5067, partial [Gemmatimonadetes bacterium]|nr:hypothetical protein [Gemmatimonadota bacterium]
MVPYRKVTSGCNAPQSEVALFSQVLILSRALWGAVMLPYQRKELSAEQRAEDLLSRMTLEEKAAQMMCVWQKKA